MTRKNANPLKKGLGAKGKLAVIQRDNSQKTRGKGKPFVEGDSRINRKGRPKNHDQLRALIQAVGAEAVGAQTTIERMVRAMFKSVNARDRQNILEHGWGKVPQELTGKDGGPIEVKGFNYATAIANLAPRPVADSESPGANQSGGDGAAVGQDVDGEQP